MATGLTSPEYTFTPGTPEAEGVWTYRVSASNESPESEFSGASVAIKVDRSAPVVVSEPASSVTQTSATLNATVNPKDQTVSDCHFEYGTTEAYGTIVPCSSPPGSGESPVAVSAALSMGSLSENTTYHYRISATNVNGTSYGSDQSFTTLPNAPAVVTGSASSITRFTATVNATVNPEGVAVSDCHFDYGTSEAYGTSVPCSSLPGSGESPVAVSAALSGLSENTTYFFRIVATNTGGTSFGSAQTFTTLANATPPHWYSGGTKVKQGVKVPVVSWGGAVNITQGSGFGQISCRTLGAGTIENPVGGGAGTGQTQVSGFYECSAPQCEAAGAEKGIPTIGRVVASNFPWKDELTEGGSPNAIREKIGTPFSMFGPPAPGEIVRTVSCETPAGFEPHTVLFSETLQGQLEPEIGPGLNGTSASKPSSLRYAGSSSGNLHTQLGGEGSNSGSAKYMGYNGQEVLTVGAP